MVGVDEGAYGIVGAFIAGVAGAIICSLWCGGLCCSGALCGTALFIVGCIVGGVIGAAAGGKGIVIMMTTVRTTLRESLYKFSIGSNSEPPSHSEPAGPRSTSWPPPSKITPTSPAHAHACGGARAARLWMKSTRPQVLEEGTESADYQFWPRRGGDRCLHEF